MSSKDFIGLFESTEILLKSKPFELIFSLLAFEMIIRSPLANSSKLLAILTLVPMAVN